MRTGDWSAPTDQGKHSVFQNYGSSVIEVQTGENPKGGEDFKMPQSLPMPAAAEGRDTLQRSIDRAVARAYIHRFLAKAYEDPTLQGWQWMTDAVTRELLRHAGAALDDRMKPAAARLAESLRTENFEAFHSAYLAGFGHAARGSCPLNEIEYGELKADPLFQPHRLADLAAFYRAFGLEMAEDAGERHDHLSIELEFLCVLAAKEAYALENQLEPGELAICRDAQKKFLREHLARWTPALARRISAFAQGPLQSLAEFTRVFIESECAAFQVTPGNDDLLLRPMDEAAETLCASCGISNLPPGALTST